MDKEELELIAEKLNNVQDAIASVLLTVADSDATGVHDDMLEIAYQAIKVAEHSITAAEVTIKVLGEMLK